MQLFQELLGMKQPTACKTTIFPVPCAQNTNDVVDTPPKNEQNMEPQT